MRRSRKRPYKRRLPHPTNAPRHYGASRMKLKRSSHKQLLVCIRTTIGLRCKQLFVSYANNYSFVPQTTIEADTNNYCFTPPPREAWFTRLHLSKESPRKQAVLFPQPNDLIADIWLGLSSYLSSAPVSAKASHTRARSSATRGSTYAPYIKKLSKYPHGNAPSYR